MIRAGRRSQLSECFLAFVIAHQAAVMLRHSDAESALESSRRAARHRISLVPSEGLGAFVSTSTEGNEW